MAAPQYNRSIRKIITAFGDMFNNIPLVKYNLDQTEQQRMIVPIEYAAKEDYVMVLQSDPRLDKKVMITLPRMSYEMMGITYDATRKQNTNIKNYAQSSSGSVIGQYNPVPYNFDFNLYLYVRNIEDGTQIIEHIVPFFAPDYTIKVNLIPEMGIIKEIPIVLNSAVHATDYEGPLESRDVRNIIWTLNFTVKGFIYPTPSTVNIIRHSITNVYNFNDPSSSVNFTLNTANTGSGLYQTGEIVYQGYSLGSATATAKVVGMANNNHILTLSDLNGNFINTLPIIGTKSTARYLYTSYDNNTSIEIFRVDSYVSPITANISDLWSANTTITEY